jgi:rod shape determining protein RodA
MRPVSPITVPDAVAPEQRGSLRAPLDPLLTLAVLGLAVCSLVTLGGATRNLIPGAPHYYVDRQGVYLGIGVVLMLVLSRIDYGWFRLHMRLIYGALILSILAVLGAGHTARGSQRAITLSFFSFQASELGKVLLTVALAGFVVGRARRLGERDTTLLVMLGALIPAILVIVQPDLGSGMVYVVIAFTLLFIAGTSWKHLSALVALGVVSLTFVLVAAPAAGVHVLKPYQVQRLTAFLHPPSSLKQIKESEAKTGEPDPAYQLRESEIAIGSGGKTGRGVNATQTRLNFVPEDHTDFVFAAVGEQYGFLGSALVLSLFGLLIWRAVRILLMAKDLFGSLVAAGVAAMLSFQVFVNVGMTIGIMPITGVTLPLMSYGGSSVVTVLLAVGLLQSIYLQARAAESLKGRVPR